MSLTVPTGFESNCSACDSLCCVATSRKERDGYKSNCEVGEVCPNLNIQCLVTSCKIYGVLESMGWEACKTYECYGAGPMVKAAFNNIDINWRDANEVDKNSLFAFFRFTKYVFNIIAQTPDQAGANNIKPKIEGGLNKVFKHLLLNPLMDDETMFETFLIECPEFLLLPEPELTTAVKAPSSDLSPTYDIAAE